MRWLLTGMVFALLQQVAIAAPPLKLYSLRVQGGCCDAERRTALIFASFPEIKFHKFSGHHVTICVSPEIDLDQKALANAFLKQRMTLKELTGCKPPRGKGFTTKLQRTSDCSLLSDRARVLIEALPGVERAFVSGNELVIFVTEHFDRSDIAKTLQPLKMSIKDLKDTDFYKFVAS